MTEQPHDSGSQRKPALTKAYTDPLPTHPARTTMTIRDFLAKQAFILNAASLLSDDGENKEYDRAIVELVAISLGFSSDDYPVVASMLKALKS